MPFPVLLVLFATALFAPVSQSATPRDIVVGTVADQTGENLEASRDYLAGARVYFDAVNARGGIKGRRIVVVAKDGSSDSTQAVALVGELIRDYQPAVLFGLVGDREVDAVIRSENFRRSGVALFAPLSGSDTSTTGQAVFFLRPTYATEAGRIVDWFNASGLTAGALVSGSTQYAAAVRVAVGERLRRSSTQLVADVVMAADGSDAKAVAARIAQASPQFVVVVADTIATAQFAKAFRPRAQGVVVVGLSNVNQQTYFELAGPTAAPGTWLMQVVPNPRTGMLAVAREHLVLMKQYRDELPSHLTFEGFIAAKMLVAALRSIDGEIDRASVNAALRTRREFDAGGFVVAYPGPLNRGSSFSDISLLRKDGTLLQ
jgi:branched-chain amino acid transport system substrate-binding protein